MEKKEISLDAAIEAVLFAVGSAVDEDTLINAMTGENEKKITKTAFRNAVKDLQARLDLDESGIRLIQLGDKYQLCTKNDYFDILARVVNTPKKHVLTDVVLETLSIVAYKQPVTRAEIEKIRGVSSQHAVNKLVEYDLIQEVGRLDAPGHPILFGTTDDFLRSFGISSMDDLPDISPDKIADFKKQAEEEAGIQVET